MARRRGALIAMVVIGVASACGSGRSPEASPTPNPSPSPSPTPPPPPSPTLLPPPSPTLLPPAGWTDLTALIPDAVLDARYATARNVLGRPFAPARCWLRSTVATRLARAAARLRADGHRLVLWDCYRPAAAQAALWAHRPDARYVAQPRFDAAGKLTAGSRHNRGAAVDVSLADAAGAPRLMPTDHDEFTSAAHRSRALAGTTAAAANARALDDAMRAVGFSPVATEWWHFDDPDGDRLGLADL